MTLVAVKIRPRSRNPGIEKAADGSLVVRVAAAPEKDRANREVVERMAGYLGVPTCRLKIVRGRTSSRKTVLIEKPSGKRGAGKGEGDP